MERRIFHELVDPDRVIEIIEKHIKLKPLGVEEVSLQNAIGRVLAEDLYAPIDHPPFDRSIVDGYAVKSVDVAGADELKPVELRVKGFIEPGVRPGIEIDHGETVEIATGAMLPRGADSVVMVEYTKRLGDRVLIYRSTVPRENVSITGSDVSMGDLVLVHGTILTPQVIGFLAGLGIVKVKVYRRPRIAVFSIGDEVVEPGSPLELGKVYDVNGYLITAILKDMGLNVDFKGVLNDDEQLIYSVLKKSLTEYDVLITSGGTSAGLGDLVYRVFDKLGEPGIVVHGLKIKPGKPTIFAVVDGKLLIGLPGFPLSCYMVLHRIVKPIMYRLLGIREPPVKIIKARLPFRLKKPIGKTWYVPVYLVKTRNGYTAYPVSLESGSISPLINSDGFLILPSNTDILLEDSIVNVELFRDVTSIPNLNIIGSNDYLLYQLLVANGLIRQARVIVTGSMGGWIAVKRGEADIAPTHLLDEDTMEYNTPFLDKMGIRDRAVLVKGYERLIGIIVEKGNPKKIESIEDFLREDIVIVNRTKGSGTRVYLDHLLKQIAMEKGIEFHELVSRIKGYYYEVKTHTAVAAAIKHGRADAGLGLGVVAKLYGLDFIPLTWERYDFLIPRSRLDKEEVRIFIDTLKNHGFMENLINKYQGYYRLLNDTGSTIS